MSDSPKLLPTTHGTILVVHWANQDFSLAAALMHAWCDVSEWHKFAIAIITLVFPEPGDCWGCINWQKCHWSNYCDDEFSLSDQITSVGIYIFAKSFEIDYFANAFPYKHKTQHYQQRQVWYRNASLSRHADRCAQAEFMKDDKVVTWRCFHDNALFGIWLTDARREFGEPRFWRSGRCGSFWHRVWGIVFFRIRHTTPLCTLETIPVETLPMINVITHKLLDSGQQHMWPHPQAITRRSNDV